MNSNSLEVDQEYKYNDKLIESFSSFANKGYSLFKPKISTLNRRRVPGSLT